MKRRKPKRTNWRQTAETLERLNEKLTTENQQLRRENEAFKMLRDVVVDSIRDDVQNMVEEAVQELDIHIG